ncbi:MAG: hypothetical protein ACREQ9_19675, partial [Candidatus Binatia bacterium]
ITLDAASEGDPLPVSVCASCNEGKDPQGQEAVELEFLPNDPDVGCRCVGATCVFCIDECTDEDCEIDLETDEASGCVEPAISLELDEEDFAEGERLPVTIDASSRLGDATLVVHLVRATPTPTATATATTVPTPTPTSSLPLPLP